MAVSIVGSEYIVLSDNRTFQINSIDFLNGDIYEVYDKVEILVDMEATFDYALDPEEINLWAEFYNNNTSLIYKSYGYFHTDYTRSLSVDTAAVEGSTPAFQEVLTYASTGWRIRFAPPDPGTYSVSVSAYEQNSDSYLHNENTLTFYVSANSSKKGFIRKDNNSKYFRFDNGESFYPIALNMAFSWMSGGTYTFDMWIDKFAEHGGNCIKTFPGPEWNILNFLRNYNSDYSDIGLLRFGDLYMPALARYDYIFEKCAEKDVYVMLTLEYNPIITGHKGQTTQNLNYLYYSVYNEDLGGPIAVSHDLYSNDTAKTFMKNKYRYLISRYGWSPNLFVMPLQAETTVGNSTYYSQHFRNFYYWHTEMIDYLKNNDADTHRHIFFTTIPPAATHYVTQATDQTLTDGSTANIYDLLCSNNYLYTKDYNIVEQLKRLSKFKDKLTNNNLPHIITEDGQNFSKYTPDVEINQRYAQGTFSRDIHGKFMASSSIASITSMYSGTNMFWWWEYAVDTQDKFWAYEIVNKFIQNIDFNNENFNNLDNINIDFVNRADFSDTISSSSNYTLCYRDLFINDISSTYNDWGTNTYTIYDSYFTFLNSAKPNETQQTKRVGVNYSVKIICNPRPFETSLIYDISHLQTGASADFNIQFQFTDIYDNITNKTQVIKTKWGGTTDGTGILFSSGSFYKRFKVIVPPLTKEINWNTDNYYIVVKRWILTQALHQYRPDYEISGIKGNNYILISILNRNNHSITDIALNTIPASATLYPTILSIPTEAEDDSNYFVELFKTTNHIVEPYGYFKAYDGMLKITIPEIDGFLALKIRKF